MVRLTLPAEKKTLKLNNNLIMAKEEMKIGEQSKPRFEFRSFGQCFCEAHKRMARLSVPVPEKVWERESDEIYIISSKNDINNTKIRNGKMDIKTYVQTVDGLEQWNPLMKGEFPISREVLEKEVFPAFMVEMPALTKDTYTYEEFIAMVKANKDLAAVRVHKQRFGYMVNDTICEVGNVLINGAKVVTINSESTEIEDIKKTIADVGLEGVENINYLQAIKRVIGMSDKPLANEESMAQEIEKKFLVKCNCFKDEAFKATRITQGYLSSVPERTVRVRVKGEKGFITIKGIGNASGAARFEWEKEIPVDEVKQLLDIAEPGVIDKTRYLVKNTDGVHTWEVDEFYGDNDGLTVAEVELADENEPFDKPAWLGEEVTGDPKYFNSMLMKNPYKNWK